jgi:capsule polysaccharide export protein KpsE/RkpR
MSHRNDREKVFSNTKIRRVLKDFGQDINDMQIRKIVFHIRNNHIIPLLLANNEGYYIGTNIQQVNSWIETQEGKIEAMKMTLQSIKEQMSEKMTALVNGEANDMTGQMSIFDFIS